MKFRVFALLICILMLSGCGGTEPTQEQVTRSTFAMDTFITLTAYGEGAEAALDAALAEIALLDGLLSTTDADSEIYRANESTGEGVSVSPPTAVLVAQTLDMCAKTGGALDISIYPIVRAWGFTLETPKVPTAAELAALLPLVDYSQISLEGDTLYVPEGMMIDLGAVAKGYCGDRLAEIMAAHGVESALLDLGGNIHTVGAKPDGSPWRIAVQDPLSAGSYLAVLDVVGKAVITSGGYERYFEEDGEIYWHILDPDSGIPAVTGLVSVTVVGDTGLVCDALSTALFVMGREAAIAYYEDHRDFELVLVTDRGEVIITPGLADCFTLTEDSYILIVEGASAW